MGGTGCIPLWAQGGQAGLGGHGIGQRQRPAGCHLHGRHALHQRQGQGRGLQQLARLGRGQGEYHFIESRADLRGRLGRLHMQAPAARAGLAFELGHALAQMQAVGVPQRRGPGHGQGLHVGRGHPMGLGGCGCGAGLATLRIQHAQRAHAPGAAQAGHGLQGQLEALVAHGEILRADVEGAMRGVDRAHAPAHLGQPFVDMDIVAGLHQRAGAGQARHAGTDHGDAARAGLGARLGGFGGLGGLFLDRGLGGGAGSVHGADLCGQWQIPGSMSLPACFAAAAEQAGTCNHSTPAQTARRRAPAQCR